MGPTASSYDNQITGAAGIGVHHQWRAGRPDTGREIPRADRGWNAPGPSCPRRQAARAQPRDPARSRAERPFAHHVSGGVRARAVASDPRSPANFVLVRGFNQLGTIDYNPIVPSLGRGPAPAGHRRARGHVGLGASVHVVRRDLVQGTRSVCDESVSTTTTSSWRATRSRRLKTTPPISTSGFLPQNNGRGRDPTDPTRASDWLRSRQRARAFAAGSAASSRAERDSMLRPTGSASRRSSAWRRDGRSTFWPALISTVTATAARSLALIAPAPFPPTLPPRSDATTGRCHRRRRLICGSTRRFRWAVERAWKHCSRSSIWPIAPTSPTSTTCSVLARTHRARCPPTANSSKPLSPRQAQLALKVTF